jgi:hypothetical protein
VREIFASHGLNLSKDALVRGIPATFWINGNLLNLIPLATGAVQQFCTAWFARGQLDGF